MLPAQLTTSVAVPLLVTGPLVPVTVIVYVPGAGFELVETVSIDVPEPPGTGFKLKLLVLRAGSPLTLNCTFELNPLVETTFTV